MLIRLLVLFTAILDSTPAVYGQNCKHTHLSGRYDFETAIVRIPRGDYWDSSVVRLTIIEKRDKKQVQQITINSTFLFSSAFSNCNAVRSYVTGLNSNLADTDNDFGDLVIADLNFDGAEDIALKQDSGGNAGPVYNFYLQQKNRQFIADTFLTKHMEFFPTRINVKSRTLVTLAHANAYQMAEHTYKFNQATGKWEQIKHRLITY